MTVLTQSDTVYKLLLIPNTSAIFATRLMQRHFHSALSELDLEPMSVCGYFRHTAIQVLGVCREDAHENRQTY
jgi:hypothetical protein